MILTRYVTRLILGGVGLVLSAAVLLVATAGLFERVDLLARVESPLNTALSLIWHVGVQQAYELLPLCGLLGALLATTWMARHGELVAVACAGLPHSVMWRAAFWSGTAAVVVGYFVGELLVPRAVTSLASLSEQEFGRVDKLSRNLTRPAPWIEIDDWLVYLPEIRGTLAAHPTFYRLDQVGGSEVVEVIRAELMRYDDGVWHLLHARVHDLGGDVTSTYDVLPAPMTLAPRALADLAQDPRSTSFFELGPLIERRRRVGLDVLAHSLIWHERLARPLTALPLVFLGALWTVASGQAASLAGSLAWGLGLVAGFIALTQLFRPWAMGGDAGSMLAAWVQPMAALCACLAALWLRRRRSW